MNFIELVSKKIEEEEETVGDKQKDHDYDDKLFSLIDQLNKRFYFFMIVETSSIVFVCLSIHSVFSFIIIFLLLCMRDNLIIYITSKKINIYIYILYINKNK